MFDHASMSTASWLMDMMRISIELLITHGLVPNNLGSELDLSELSTLKRKPRTVTTAIKWLKIDPFVIYMNCCKNCFALYLLERSPKWCTHLISSTPGQFIDAYDANTEILPENLDSGPKIKHDFLEEQCGQLLLQFSRGREISTRRYAFQNLSDWLAQLYSRPNFEAWLDKSLVESRRPLETTSET